MWIEQYDGICHINRILTKVSNLSTGLKRARPHFISYFCYLSFLPLVPFRWFWKEKVYCTSDVFYKHKSGSFVSLYGNLTERYFIMCRKNKICTLIFFMLREAFCVALHLTPFSEKVSSSSCHCSHLTLTGVTYIYMCVCLHIMYICLYTSLYIVEVRGVY